MSDRDELLRRAVDALGDTPFALIGGQAVIFHGATRVTRDFDLLTATTDVLLERRWPAGDPPVEIRRGDAVDSLDGVAALEYQTDDDGQPLPGTPAPVEVIVLDRPWARAILARAHQRVTLGGVTLPVVDVADLVILKAYAGGPIDVADVAALSLRADWSEIRSVVEERLAAAGPPAAIRSWRRILRILEG